jgi:hypothetical protein
MGNVAAPRLPMASLIKPERSPPDNHGKITVQKTPEHSVS